MGTKSFFKNQTGLPANKKGAVKGNLTASLADIESPFHAEEYFEEKNYLLPDIDYSKLSNYVRYGLAHEYYNNAFKRIRTQYPYDGSAAEKLSFYNNLTPFERYVYDEKYPKYNGHITLGLGSTYGEELPSGFGTTTKPQYVRFYGGPHQDNVIDSDVGQENNLHVNLNDGLTVEFWLKKNGSPNKVTQTEYEALLNLRNETDTQRFTLFLSGSEASAVSFHQEFYDGSAWQTLNTGSFDLSSVVTTVADNTWRHLAFTFKKQESDSIQSIAYVNGKMANTKEYVHGVGSPIYTITGSVVGTIGGVGGKHSAAAPDTSAIESEAGFGKSISASFDDFRIWKTARTGKQVGLNWFRGVDGGTNTDTSKYFYTSSAHFNKVDLGVYFKFNEGVSSVSGSGLYVDGNEVTSSTSIGDNLIVDYSGRINNGTFIGYDSTLSMRSEESAMVAGGYAQSETKDPLLFEDNPNYNNTLTPLLTSGSNYDVSNGTALYSNIPQWMRDLDNFKGQEIKKLFQVVGSYFDTMHAQIEHVKNFKEAQYISSSNKTTDYAARLLQASGFNVPEMFVDPDVLATIFDQDEKRTFEDKLYNLKNKVYKNIYANLTSILKSKGTEKAFRNLFRCYGTDDELFKINLYADGVEYQIDDKVYDSIVKKRLVDFSGFEDSDDREGVIFQYHSGSDEQMDSYGYFPSSSNENIPMTIEAQILFPKKPDIASLQGLQDLTTASLFGVHSASIFHNQTHIPTTTDHGDIDFQVQTRRNSSGHAQFVLTSSTGFIPMLTSSFFADEDKLVYDGIPWQLAVRLYPQEYPFSSYVKDSTTFTLNFYGVKTHLGEKLAQFETSASISHVSASQFLTGSNKRFFLGAHRTNITGALLNRSDVKFSRFMVWNSFLTNDEITKHSRNPKNYGLSNPQERAFTYESAEASASFILKADTLALNWEFDTIVSSSDEILDSASGSLKLVEQYPMSGFGKHNSRDFTARWASGSTSGDFTKLDFMQGSIIHRPDSLYGKNMIRLLNNDFDAHQMNKKPVKYFFAFEASQNEVLSRDILNFFADVISFNNMYGEVVHSYRDNYKQLEHFKHFYFSRVNKVEDLDKFVNLYKFLDSALDSVIPNLVPASAATSEKIRTVVEDHVLDRHKVKRHYELLLQSFDNDYKNTEGPPGNEGKHVPKTEKLNTDNVDLTGITLTNVNNRPDLTIGATQDDSEFTVSTDYPKAAIKSATTLTTKGDPTLSYKGGGNYVDEEGFDEANRSLERSKEVTRLPNSDGNFVKRYVYMKDRAEKDRNGSPIIVGTKDVDTLRTQLDIIIKTRNAMAASTPYAVRGQARAIKGETLSTNTSNSDDIFLQTRRFQDTSADGILVTIQSSSAPLIEDHADTALYGKRFHRALASVGDSSSEAYGEYTADTLLGPMGIQILSSSNRPFNSGIGFEVYQQKPSVVSSVGIKTLDSQLLKDEADRKEKYSVNIMVGSAGANPDIRIQSPQIKSDNAGSFKVNSSIPTNLVHEVKRSYITKYKSGFNWDGTSGEIFGITPSDRDISTLAVSGNIFSYSAAKTVMVEEISGLAAYDRKAISRVENTSSTSEIRAVDRAIFRDRYDLENEQASPQQNLNYKNLNIKRALRKAYSTPLANDGHSYRSIGQGAGTAIYSGNPNPHLRLEVADRRRTTDELQSYVVEYDSAYITRNSQNNYDQRWFRATNIIRLGDYNNAPYVNSHFSSIATDILDYAPLTASYYDEEASITIPNSEEVVTATPFGSQRIDFHGTNIVVGRDVTVDASGYEIDGMTSGSATNPNITAGIAEGKKLHMYFLNSSGPYKHSLGAARLRHVQPVLKNSTYRNSIPVEISETREDEGTVRIETAPIFSKGLLNTAIVKNLSDDTLHATNYEISYPRLSEYFTSGSTNFRALPNEYKTKILDISSNHRYICIFDENVRERSNFELKYFDFGEYIYPRRQKILQTLTQYDREVGFDQRTAVRKIALVNNSLGQPYEGISGEYLNCLFSSWPVETFEIEKNFGVTITTHDGELMAINHNEAFKHFANISTGPFEIATFAQLSLGYKINFANRPDSVSPDFVNDRKPFRYFDETVTINAIDNPSKGAIVEYRRENTVDNYLKGEDVESSFTLFGHPSSGKSLLGEACYTEEIFELKDIHRQIDKF